MCCYSVGSGGGHRSQVGGNLAWAAGELFTDEDDPIPLTNPHRSDHAAASARFYSSWLLVAAYVPLLVLYVAWGYLTASGQIEGKVTFFGAVATRADDKGAALQQFDEYLASHSSPIHPGSAPEVRSDIAPAHEPLAGRPTSPTPSFTESSGPAQSPRQAAERAEAMRATFKSTAEEKEF